MAGSLTGARLLELSMKRMAKLNIRLSNDILAALRHKASVTGLSMSAIVRDTVEKALDEEERLPASKRPRNS
jgi:predicted DNA binding CopG/RHH family protein